MKFFFAIACALLFIASVSAQSTPEPPVDPFTPTIDITQAGDQPVATIATNVAGTVVKICPSSYPAGYSVRCNIDTTTSVIWRIDGTLFKKEYFAPYYIAGNWDKKDGSISRVRPFMELGDKSILVSCTSLGKNVASVTLMKSC